MEGTGAEKKDAQNGANEKLTQGKCSGCPDKRHADDKGQNGGMGIMGAQADSGKDVEIISTHVNRAGAKGDDTEKGDSSECGTQEPERDRAATGAHAQIVGIEIGSGRDSRKQDGVSETSDTQNRKRRVDKAAFADVETNSTRLQLGRRPVGAANAPTQTSDVPGKYSRVDKTGQVPGVGRRDPKQVKKRWIDVVNGAGRFPHLRPYDLYRQLMQVILTKVAKVLLAWLLFVLYCTASVMSILAFCVMIFTGAVVFCADLCFDVVARLVGCRLRSRDSVEEFVEGIWDLLASPEIYWNTNTG